MEPWRAELYHHGIKGQKWGVRRGPPYPLGEGKGRRNPPKTSGKPVGRVDNRVEKSYASSKNFSKALKVGAVAALTGLAVYGAYKSGYLTEASKIGRQAVEQAMGKVGSLPTGSLGDFTPPSGAKSSQSAPKPKHAPVIRDPKTGFKLINEPLSESLKNANPLKTSSEGDNNCAYCAVAGFLRTLGYDVTARSTGGRMQNMGGVLEDCFKGVKVYEGSAMRFAKSPEDAAQMLKKRFGDNASGAVGIDFRGGRGGHVFSWTIRDGAVEFLDFQQGVQGARVLSYWPAIDPAGNLTFARLDADRNGNKLEINLDTINKYVDGR